MSWHQQVLTAVGYQNKQLLFPEYIDKDIVVRLWSAALHSWLQLHAIAQGRLRMPTRLLWTSCGRCTAGAATLCMRPA